MNLALLVTEDDIEEARALAGDIVLNRPKSNFSAFSDSPEIVRWAKERSENLTTILTTGMGDPRSATGITSEVLESAILEAFLVAFVSLTKLLQSKNEDLIPPDLRDTIKLELWERGLLSPEHYQFDPDDEYLRKVKDNHENIMVHAKKIQEMRAKGEVT